MIRDFPYLQLILSLGQVNLAGSVKTLGDEGRLHIPCDSLEVPECGVELLLRREATAQADANAIHYAFSKCQLSHCYFFSAIEGKDL